MDIPVPWSNTCLPRTAESVVEVLDRSLGIYSTQPTGHLELLARFDGYRLTDLEHIMVVDRRAVGLRTLRGSGMIIPVDLLPVIQAATREHNLRSTSGLLRGRLETPYETWASRILDVLGDGPLAAADIRRALGDTGPDAELIRYVISAMATENRIVAAGTTGTWRSDRTRYARWTDWLPDVDVWSMDGDTARAELAIVYLERHGPATGDDFAFWSGLSRTVARRLFTEVAEPIAGTDYWSVGELPDDEPPHVRLLPIWDTLFVTYRHRSRLVGEADYGFVYDASGNATSVVLVDGMAAGVWDLGKDDRELEVRVAPFRSFDAEVWTAIDEEVARIAGLIGAEAVEVVRCVDPFDLGQQPRNYFMSPLRNHAAGR